MRAAVRRLLAQSLVPHEQQTRCPGPDVPVTSKPSGGHPAPVWAAPDTPATQGAGLHGGTAFRFLLGWRLGVPRVQGGGSRMPVTWRQMSLGSGEVRRDLHSRAAMAPAAGPSGSAVVTVQRRLLPGWQGLHTRPPGGQIPAEVSAFVGSCVCVCV